MPEFFAQGPKDNELKPRMDKKMADEDINQELAAPSKPASSKNPLLTVLLLVNTIIMGAVAYFQYQSFLKISSQESVQDILNAQNAQSQDGVHSEDFENTGEAKKDDGILFPLDPFTANLAQGDGPRRFIRLNAVLKFSPDSSEAEFNARKPQIRDTIISTLNSKRSEDLLESTGKEILKEELKAAINTFLVDGRVEDIFYVGFQIN